jgi:hypothetical protein
MMRDSSLVRLLCLLGTLSACQHTSNAGLAASAAGSPAAATAGVGPAAVGGAAAPVMLPAGSNGNTAGTIAVAPTTVAGSGGGNASNAPAPAGSAAPSGGLPLPCNVSAVIAKHCTTCHGKTPRLGAPMSLVSAEDFQQPAMSDHSRKVYERVSVRIADATNPMPPSSSSKLSADELSALTKWATSGAPAATAAEAAACGSVVVPDPTPVQPDPIPSDENVTCYDLTVHGKTGTTDTSPFSIPTGETYNCFYFDAPWKDAALSVAFRSKLDNDRALHHWFLYAMPTKHAAGTVENNCLPLHLDGPKMLAGWAPGGKDMTMPKDVGAETAAAGSTLMLEWHYFNNTGAALADRSSVSVCTVPMGGRPNVAAVSWLGTENLSLPAKTETSATGTCSPGRSGLMASAPIHLLYTTPHMHQYGTHMKLAIQRVDGSKADVFDLPFSDKNQNFIETPAELLPGEKLLTTCTFMNTSNATLSYGGPFGAGSGEMCYGFVLHYPAHALDNGTRSILGASNSCL